VSLTQRFVNWLVEQTVRHTGLPEPLMRILGWTVACVAVIGVALFTVIYLIYVER
jgi:hypothetical protein